MIFNISDYRYRYKEFGARLDVMLQTSLESGTLESAMKERNVYIYPIEDATIYILKNSSTNKLYENQN